MTTNWNGVKLLEMMAKNETKVAEIYREIAKHANDGNGSQFFEMMAKDEERHHEIYSNLLEQYNKDGYFSVEMAEEEAGYLDDLISSSERIDTKKLFDDAGKIHGRQQIYDIAEHLERETVMFVDEIIAKYPELAPEEMKIIQRDEKGHLRKILQRRKDFALGAKGM